MNKVTEKGLISECTEPIVKFISSCLLYGWFRVLMLQDTTCIKFWFSFEYDENHIDSSWLVMSVNVGQNLYKNFGFLLNMTRTISTVII